MEYVQENTSFSTTNKESCDLVVYQCGMEKCKPSHSFGPAIRDHFLIHFIISGKGTFYVDGKSYKLGINEGFLICPDILTYYEADQDNPWSYEWVGFRGIKSELYLSQAKLNRYNPVFKHKDGEVLSRCLDDLRKAASLKFGSDLRLQGNLAIFLSELIEIAENDEAQGSNFKELYTKKALQYIENNYSRNISVADIANYIGLNKNYFSTLFKEILNISPQEYLIKYRINKACKLMDNKNLSISDISRSVGYVDPLGFSKIFKKINGCSPKQYRDKSSDISAI